MSVVDLFQQIASNDFGFFQQVKTVAHVMTKEPVSLTLDDTFESAEKKFRTQRILHAPVVNPEDNSVVGIVSDRDLLRHRPPLLGKAAEGEADHRALRDGVARFMTRNPIWCSADSSPVHAMTLMLNHHIDSVLVSADGKTLDGIVTPLNFIQTLLLYHRVCTRDYDLRRLRLVDLDFSNGLPLDEIFSRGAQTVRDVMTKDVETLAEDEPLHAAMQLMQEKQIRHVPVVNKDKKMLGMLSDREILKQLPVPENRSEDSESAFREVLFETDDKAARHLRVDAVMNKDGNAVSPDMLLTDAMAILEAKHIGGVPVVDGGKLIGILTCSDILRVFRVVMQLGLLADHQSADQA